MKYASASLGLYLLLYLATAVAQTDATVATLEPARLQSLEAAAARREPKAQMQLAAKLLHGQGVARDVHKALHYYQDAAEAGIAYAQHRLARLYLDGERVPHDPAQALSWMLRAAQLGFVEAQLDLSELYANGQYMDRDLVNARKWLAIAASLTDLDLDRQQGELEEKMSFVERVKAGYLARSCMLKDYRDC